MEDSERICPTCNCIVYGRKKKRFCSIDCKNEHHKIARKQVEEVLYLKNEFIRRNKVVLEGLLGVQNNKVIVHRDMLFKVGFNLNSFLNAVKKKGRIIYQIFEFEFCLLNNGLIEVVRTNNKKEYYQEFIDRWVLEFPDEVYLEIVVGVGGMKLFLRKSCMDTSKWLTVKPFNNRSYREVSSST